MISVADDADVLLGAGVVMAVVVPGPRVADLMGGNGCEALGRLGG